MRASQSIKTTGALDCVYGLLGFSTFNLGDDIQSLAVRPFLPRVDFVIDRDFLGVLDLRIPAKIVLNGWFCQVYKQVEGRHEQSRVGLAIPGTSLVQFLVTSFNCDFIISRPAPKLESHVFRFLERNQPIGCRDTCTLEILTARGLTAYFSGCMSLLLRPQPGLLRDGILAVDSTIPVDARRFAKTFATIRNCTQLVDRRMPFASRFELAAERLLQFQRSSAVVTSRLHVALPCVAFGVPVVFVAANVGARYRVDDYIDLFDSVVHTEEELSTVLRSPIECKPKPRLAEIQKHLRSSLHAFLGVSGPYE